METVAIPTRVESGTIPFRLRVGVTGHRTLPDDPALAAQVERTLERVRALAPSSPATPVRLSVVSPLAEGADRLVARAVLADATATLEAGLPFPRERYLEDFATDASRAEFDALLARAETISVLPPSESAEEAYANVGRYVAERSDVVIALWDGEPARGLGGTAEVVELARALGVPLLWVRTTPPYLLTEETDAGVAGAAFSQLDAYNRELVDTALFARQVARETATLGAAWREAGLPAQQLPAAVGWSLPYYVRADVLALRAQARYLGVGTALFLSPVAAVAALAAQVLFLPEFPGLIWLEVALMVAVLLGFGIGRLWRLHERWIFYRFLAERLRAAPFLAMAGVGTDPHRGPERASLGQAADEWLRRAFDEAWARAPGPWLDEANLDGLKRFLLAAWIRPQREYHRRASVRHQHRHRRLTRATEVLFGVILVGAVLHALGVGHGGSGGPGPDWGKLLVFLGLTIPALAGALGGILAQREYRRNAERLGRMGPYLEIVERRLLAARTPAGVRIAAQEAENVMLDENRDWFTVMRFHDFELHV